MTVELEEKGRVYNRSNEQYLRTAYAAIKQALAALKPRRATDEEEADEESAETTARTSKSAATTAKEAGGFNQTDTYSLLQAALSKALGGSYSAYIQDIYEDTSTLVYRRDYNGGYFQLPFTVEATGAVTFGAPSEVVRKVTYISPISPAGDISASESGSASVPYVLEDETQPIPLIERALRADGTTRIKLIAPGKGSSGYYSREVLERDIPRVFPKGTKMFWDHQTAVEEAQKPEGDLDRFSAVLTTTPVWETGGKHGAGMYADIKVFENKRAVVDEIAEHIGVSIRASGKARMGEIAGVGRVPIIEEITSGKSVDFVTTAGAGGKILNLFESAKRSAPSNGDLEMAGLTEDQVRALISEATAPLTEANARLTEALYVSQASRIVERQLSRDNYPTLPAATRDRLAATLATQYTLTESGALDSAALITRIGTAVQNELTYLSEAAGANFGVSGMGSGAGTGDAGDLTTQLEAGFMALGMQESAAKRAVSGRSNG